MVNEMNNCEHKEGWKMVIISVSPTIIVMRCSSCGAERCPTKQEQSEVNFQLIEKLGGLK